MKACFRRVTFPSVSKARATAWPVTTWTPFSRSGRNSLESVASSSRRRLRTLPPGLSGHSAVYTRGPRCSATRPWSASTEEWATTLRTGMGSPSSMTSPLVQTRSSLA